MIKIKNETELNTRELNTRELKVLFNRCLKEFNSYYFIRHTLLKDLSVSVIYKKVSSRGLWIGGYAYLNSRSMALKIPRTLNELNGEWCYKLAQVFFHELEHCEGKTHSQMIDHHLTPYPTEWAKEYFIHQKESNPVVVKSKDDKLLDKIASLERRKIKREKKLTRSKNAIKKIEGRIKYYEKRRVSLKEN